MNQSSFLEKRGNLPGIRKLRRPSASRTWCEAESPRSEAGRPETKVESAYYSKLTPLLLILYSIGSI